MTPAFLAKLPIYLPSKLGCFLEYATVYSNQSRVNQQTEEAYFSLIADLFLIANSMPDQFGFEPLEAALNHNDVAPEVFEAFNLLREFFPEQTDWPSTRLMDKGTTQPSKSIQVEGQQLKNGFMNRLSRVWGEYRKSSFDDLTFSQSLLAFVGYIMARWQLISPRQIGPKLWRSIKHRF